MSVCVTLFSIQHPDELDAAMARGSIGSHHGPAYDHERRLGPHARIWARM